MEPFAVQSPAVVLLARASAANWRLSDCRQTEHHRATVPGCRVTRWAERARSKRLHADTRPGVEMWKGVPLALAGGLCQWRWTIWTGRLVIGRARTAAMRTRLCGWCAAPAMRREHFDRQAVSAGPSWRRWPRRTACPCRKADDCELGTASVGPESVRQDRTMVATRLSFGLPARRTACGKPAGATGRETPASGGKTARGFVRNLFSQPDRLDGVWAAGGWPVGGGVSPPPFYRRDIFGKFPTLKTGRNRTSNRPAPILALANPANPANERGDEPARRQSNRATRCQS